MSTLSLLLPFTHRRNIQQILLCACFILSIASLAYGQSKIEITDPILKSGDKWPSPLELSFTTSADIKKIRILITAPGNNSKDEFDVDPKAREQTHPVNLLDGPNDIQILGFKEGEKDSSAKAQLSVTCSGKRCGVGGGSNNGGGGGGTGQTQQPGTSNVSITKPDGAITSSPIKPTIVVLKPSNITMLSIDVTNGGDTVDHRVAKVNYLGATNVGYVQVPLKLGQGDNKITAYSVETVGDKNNQDSLIISCAQCGAVGATAATEETPRDQKGNVHIATPDNKAKYTDSKTVPLNVNVTNSDASKNITKLDVTVLNKSKPVPQKGFPLAVSYPDPKKDGSLRAASIAVAPGTNVVRVFDPDNSDNQYDEITIECEGNCGGGGETAKITIDQPTIPEGRTSVPVQDISSIDSYVTVAQGSGITKIQYDVSQGGKPLFTSDPFPVDVSAKAATVKMTLKFLSGLNTIRVYDPDGTVSEYLPIECTGPKCATDFQVASIITNSQNTRIIVGLEQAGASSAKSETKPFLDFFFTTPIIFSRGSRELVSATELNALPVARSNEQHSTRPEMPRRNRLLCSGSTLFIRCHLEKRALFISTEQR